jgi:hypothetical protein
MNRVSTDFETPHEKWGRPYAQGRIRVLWIGAPGGQYRLISELAQRFDMEFEAVVCYGGPDAPGSTDSYVVRAEGNTPAEKKRELAQKLAKDYDVIVLSWPLKELPPVAKYRIVKSVIVARRLAFADMRIAPVVCFVQLGADQDGWTTRWLHPQWGLKDPEATIFSPKVQEMYRARAKDYVERLRVFRPFCYNLGDENYFNYDGVWGPHKVYLEENLLYVAEYMDGVKIFDVTDVRSPRLIAHHLGGYCMNFGMDVDGDCLYRGRLGALEILDVPRPSEAPSGTVTVRLPAPGVVREVRSDK